MKLPNVAEAIVPWSKVAGYLLSHEHPSGRSKAAFFCGLGFTATECETLADALRNHAAANDVSKTEATEFGTRYVVEGSLTSRDGRNPCVRTVWFAARGEDVPRLVTAYPHRRREGP